MLGLCGPHRTGKSTLARAFAEAHGILFVETSISKVYRDIGMDPAAECSLPERIAVQEILLETLCKQYVTARKQSMLFIADRTPIDMASYMLADVGRSATLGAPALSARVDDYVTRCLKATAEHFSAIVQVQPGLPMGEGTEPGKARPCVAYVEHLNAIQLGLLADERNLVRSYKIKREAIDMDERLKALGKAVDAALAAHSVLMGDRTVH